MKVLQDKVALVSGSGRGIGKAIALKLAASGAHIVVNDLDGEVAEQTAREIEALGARAIVCVGDVTATEFGERFVGAAVAAFGTIDIIVNNAGYAWDAVLQKTSDEQWAAMLDVDLTAPFRILRAAQPVIAAAAKREMAEGGRALRRTVINISSVAGLGGNPGQAAYAAGKLGVVGLTKTLMKEWGRYNVTVNAVAFGAILTRMTAGEAGEAQRFEVKDKDIKAGVSQEILEAMERGIPLGRAGTPEEAAGAVYLLCLPEADYLVGRCWSRAEAGRYSPRCRHWLPAIRDPAPRGTQRHRVPAFAYCGSRMRLGVMPDAVSRMAEVALDRLDRSLDLAMAYRSSKEVAIRMDGGLNCSRQCRRRRGSERQ